jgi:hypothetical protein
MRESAVGGVIDMGHKLLGAAAEPTAVRALA